VFLAVCLFLRRSKKKQYQGREPAFNPETEGHSNIVGPVDSLDKNIGLRHSIIGLEDAPVEQADDSQIRIAMQDLNVFIHQHAENHYHLKQVSERPGDLERALFNCGYTDRTIPSAKTMGALLTNPKTRKIAIRRLIASIMIENMGLNSNPERSLLPRHILASYQEMQRTSRLPGEEHGEMKFFFS
jgi:hypothetical protein